MVWNPVVDEWIVQWVVQLLKGRHLFKSHVEAPLGETLNPTLHPGDLAEESVIEVQAIYHLPQMDAQDQSEGLGKSFIWRVGRSEVPLL